MRAAVLALIAAFIALVPQPSGAQTHGSPLLPQDAVGAVNMAIFTVVDEYPFICNCIAPPVTPASRMAAAYGHDGVCKHDPRQTCVRLPGFATRKHAGIGAMTTALVILALGACDLRS
mmetsp:Transcript_10566/g.22221  ORF Transcript_10566/g.22221 Transcript_10566/m.22221 type:complete len:118 (+) Transcript_10566:47-400(+)